MKLVLACLSIFLSITASSFIRDSKWQLWKSFHGKLYPSFDEEHLRYTIWHENQEMIKRHNSGKHSFIMQMNHLGDLTNKEVKLILNGYHDNRKAGKKSEAVTFLEPSNVNVPKEVDWRKHGYVTKVKNQGSCGSCWAFSTTGSLEGQHFKKTGKLVSLSEQNLVDCSADFGNAGCEGGLMDNAFKYIKANGGIDTEISYPYQGEDLKCKFNKSDVGASDTGFVDVKHYCEKALKVAVATVGPVSVAIDASHMSFQFYHSGVYDEPECSSTALDHGVLAVGYGTATDGKDYWLVKNSWGSSWGEEGYIRMSRNLKNQCGIASNASYPLV